jgi:hypothetical protein
MIIFWVVYLFLMCYLIFKDRLQRTNKCDTYFQKFFSSIHLDNDILLVMIHDQVLFVLWCSSGKKLNFLEFNFKYSLKSLKHF